MICCRIFMCYIYDVLMKFTMLSSTLNKSIITFIKAKSIFIIIIIIINDTYLKKLNKSKSRK